MRFKCVSKKWFSLITNDSTFIATHLHHQSKTTKSSSIIEIRHEILVLSESKDAVLDQTYLDKSYVPLNSINIVGSCNGLVCFIPFSIPNDTKIILWNPATREIKDILGVTFPTNASFFAIAVLGFGFDENSKDYKLVTMKSCLRTEDLFNYSIERLHHAQVFTKGSICWRSLKPIKAWICGGTSVAVNGVLYWPGLRSLHMSCIWSFDLREEEFSEDRTTA
ncbi:hypothetical protein L484_003260 [Morus notabilis]|uniref:F-box associated beta-propeller type 1 domain-containing protein n=1 Tax=Morus notabilis TaxID=981085 RepID=W9R3M2_9ROSA|nr:hypothetical protein L484_003260 [Morus notabilis]